MGTKETVEKLRQFIIVHDLPKMDMALFGIRCPYCGKSDRIRQLEDPDELRGELNKEDFREYGELLTSLTHLRGSLGVCKFCNNALNLFLDEGKAEALYEGG